MDRFIEEVKRHGKIRDHHYNNAPLRAIPSGTFKIKVDNVIEANLKKGQKIVLDKNKNIEEKLTILDINDNYVVFQSRTTFSHEIGYTIHVDNVDTCLKLVDSFPKDVGFPTKNRDKGKLTNGPAQLLNSGRLQEEEETRQQEKAAIAAQKLQEEQQREQEASDRVKKGKELYEEIKRKFNGKIDDVRPKNKIHKDDLCQMAEYLKLKQYKVNLYNEDGGRKKYYTKAEYQTLIQNKLDGDNDNNTIVDVHSTTIPQVPSDRQRQQIESIEEETIALTIANNNTNNAT